MNVDGTTIKSAIATVTRSARDAWSKSPTEDGRGFLLGAEMTGKRVALIKSYFDSYKNEHNWTKNHE